MVLESKTYYVNIIWVGRLQFTFIITRTRISAGYLSPVLRYYSRSRMVLKVLYISRLLLIFSRRCERYLPNTLDMCCPLLRSAAKLIRLEETNLDWCSTIFGVTRWLNLVQCTINFDSHVWVYVWLNAGVLVYYVIAICTLEHKVRLNLPRKSNRVIIALQAHTWFLLQSDMYKIEEKILNLSIHYHSRFILSQIRYLLHSIQSGGRNKPGRWRTRRADSRSGTAPLYGWHRLEYSGPPYKPALTVSYTEETYSFYRGLQTTWNSQTNLWATR